MRVVVTEHTGQSLLLLFPCIVVASVQLFVLLLLLLTRRLRLHTSWRNVITALFSTALFDIDTANNDKLYTRRRYGLRLIVITTTATTVVIKTIRQNRIKVVDGAARSSRAYYKNNENTPTYRRQRQRITTGNTFSPVRPESIVGIGDRGSKCSRSRAVVFNQFSIRFALNLFKILQKCVFIHIVIDVW